MTGCATYVELDLVDYFSRNDSVSETHLQRIADVPRCAAIIDAFVSTPMRLGTALFLLGDELDRLQLPQAGGGPGLNGRRKTLPFGYVTLIKQIARRINLGSKDPRSIFVSAEAKQAFRETYEFRPMSELEFQLWLNNDAPFESPDKELRELWLSIRYRDELEYLLYWQVAHSEVMQAILCNRQFLAGLEASYARRSGASPDDIYGMLDEIVASRMPALSTHLRFMLYAQLAARMSRGLMLVPDGLRLDYPEYYLDWRGQPAW
jgi:hypothetical protein